MIRLHCNRRGGVGPIVAGALPVLIGSAALAVDLGAAQLDTRRLQGIADAAALAAAREPTNAAAAAQAVVAQSGWNGTVTVEALPGRYRRDPAIVPDERFQPGGAVNAVRVRLDATSPTYFAAIFGRNGVPISRTGTAMRSDHAAFSLGSRLAALDGGVLNALIGPLLGGTVSLSVLDYDALVGADVDLLAFLDALRVTAAIDAGGYGDVLAAEVTRAQLLDALAASVGEGSARTALSRMADAAGTGTVALAPLFDLGPIADLDRGSRGLVRVNAMEMLTSLLQHASDARHLDLDLGGTIGGLASTRIRIAIGDRPANSPWIAVTELGTPTLRTAQTRIHVTARLANIALPGLGTIAAIEVPLFIELASAEARMTGITCATHASRSVTIDARTGPGRAAIGRIDDARFDDFSSPVAVAPTPLLDTLLIDVDARSLLDLGTVEPWQTMRFTGTEVDAGAVRTVSSSRALEGLAVSLLAGMALDVRVAGLIPLPVGPVIGALGAALTPAGPALDRVVNTVTGALGVRYGQADVRVTGMRCGRPVLVA